MEVTILRKNFFQECIKLVDQWLKIHLHLWNIKHLNENMSKCTVRNVLSYMTNLFSNYRLYVIQKLVMKRDRQWINTEDILHNPIYSKQLSVQKYIHCEERNKIYWSSMALFPCFARRHASNTKHETLKNSWNVIPSVKASEM